MSNHPNRGKPCAPRCLNCGDPIRKRTRRVWIERANTGMRMVDSDFQRMVVTDDFPRTKADCQRLSNWVVTSVSYAAPRSYRPGTISCFSEWDGESYETISGFFCKGRCAEAFGRAAARAGWRRSSVPA